MSVFRASDAPLIARLFASDDDGARRVLADALLERGEALGELLTLEAEGVVGKRTRTLRKEVGQDLLAREYDWAEELALERGLPAIAFIALEGFAARAARAPAFPIREVTCVRGSAAGLLEALHVPLFQKVGRLNLQQLLPGRTRPTGTPVVLPALRTLALPREPFGPAWEAPLTVAFAAVETIVAAKEPAPWVRALPRVRTIEKGGI